MDITERCRAQARSMELEGWHVCASVLLQAAEEITSLRQHLTARDRALAYILADYDLG